MVDAIKSTAALEHLMGDDEANATLDEIEAELRLDNIVSIMSEPAGPLYAPRPGRPRSGLPPEDLA